MDFDDLTRRYFGNGDLDDLSPEALRAGIDRMRVDLGLEQDGGRRFALWSLLYMLDEAPNLEVVFTDVLDREAARNFIDMVEPDQAPSP